MISKEKNTMTALSVHPRNASEHADQLVAVLVEEHPDWSIEETLETAFADAWHTRIEYAAKGLEIVARVWDRTIAELVARADAHETLMNGVTA